MLRSAYPLLPLQQVLAERREAVRLAHGMDGWQPITIKFSGDVIPRQRDEAFKGAMFAAYSGDLVFSKIDARNGAVGLVPASIPKAVVTAEYPVFVPDVSKLRPAFLHHLLRAEHFRTALQGKASGTSGRKRVTPQGFLALVVPIPDLDRQDELLGAYIAALDNAARMEQEAQALEAAGWRAFEEALGLVAPPPLPDRPVFVARFKDFERWSHEGMLHDTLHLAESTPKFPTIPVGAVGNVSYGLQKSPSNRPGSHPRPYLRVANVQRWLLDLDEIKFINVPDEEMHKYQLEDGDVLLCEGNSADLVGRGAIWRNEIAECVHQNHVLRIRLDQTRAVPDFVLAVINSSFGQAYFRSKAKRTTNLASINSKEVAAFSLPSISILEQTRLVEVLDASRNAAESIRREAQTARIQAWQAFESALFDQGG